jgi:error-prone DNA polymerase
MESANDAGPPAYAELQCRSNFSFLHGASHPEELVQRAAALGYAALAIADECSLAGVVRAHVEAKRQGLHLVVGSQFRLPDFTLIVLAQNRNGYGNLAELISLARRRAEKGAYLLRPEDIEAPGPGCEHLRGLPDCLAILAPAQHPDAEALLRQAQWMREVFADRAAIALTLLHRGRDAAQRALVEAAAAAQSLPVVATGDVLMHLRSRKPLQDMLSAIRIGRPLPECGDALEPNAEQHLRSRDRLARLYPREALAAAVQFAQRCRFSLDELRYEYPDELVPPGMRAADYLRRETWIGAHWRFPGGIPPAVQAQIEHELGLIAEMAYEP